MARPPAGNPGGAGLGHSSLESWQHAESGRYRKLELTRRAVATTLPTVRRVDVRRTKLDEGLSAALLEAIGKRLERGEQSLVFLNRRGYAPVLACTACGWVSHRDHCSANQVVHLADGRMRCHHCGADNPIPAPVRPAATRDLHAFGRGTQRLEERLAELYPAPGCCASTATPRAPGPSGRPCWRVSPRARRTSWSVPR